MRIGCLFGTFDPPHRAHLAIAEHMLHHAGLDRVWLVVTPQNPFKRDVSLSPDVHRMAMVRIAVEGHPGIEASDVELALPRPNYTVDTLRHLREHWPDHRFDLIIGGDNLECFMTWKSPEEILAHHDLLVYPRTGTRTATAEAPLTGHPRVHVMANAPAVNISATGIRRAIAAGRTVDGLVEPHVADYIRRHGLYTD